MSIMPSCRDSRCWSSDSSCAIAAGGSTPFAIRSSPRGPYSTIGRGLRADGADAGAHVRHGAADERHARRHGGAGLAGGRIDRAQRERRVLRIALVVDGDAVGGALLRERRSMRTTTSE